MINLLQYFLSIDFDVVRTQLHQTQQKYIRKHMWTGSEVGDG